MSDKQEYNSNAGRFLLATAILFAVPLLYILSVGPVAAMSIKFPGLARSSAIGEFYYPVIWLHDKTPMRRPLEMYLDLWGVH